MKNRIKKGLLGIICLLLAASSTACARLPSPKEKQFDLKTATLLLDDSFETLKSSNAEASIVSEHHGYAISIKKESFSLFEENDEELTLTIGDYGEKSIETQGLTAEVETEEDVTYYVYEKEVNGKAFTYLASLYLAGDGYITVSFACETKDFSQARPDFWHYAKSVSIPEAHT